ncbi:spore gernimation protein GerPD [Pseudalkalibacillus berkeleyi]|uniref:Spore gernimation protein GerPD n=1 Tax=Pseudalkalibacillus berkeleyi TaxID=1069813 RepID=A0ABS9H0K6_9BACL|nr:spore gernimation protein GerPD [Pseudalkalibacillus berkeleyi]MCF6137373.1 spore gernimation protein GerPD [Pseudalkalibacillus berkeleyi]
MELNVVNKDISVGDIRIIGIGTSAMLLVGDSEVINCQSMFDTPPESLIIGTPLVPLSKE